MKRAVFGQSGAPKGQRVGFSISSLSGKKGILAHKDFQSPYKVGKYGVNLKDLEEIGVKAILDAVRKNKIVVIDEIGKMELYSERFKRAVEVVLDSENKVLGTIKLTSGLFADRIRKRRDTKIFYLSKENFENTKKEIFSLLKGRENN